ncbi:hypothetical protein GQ44DRAFT_707193 [Phaeosphaeriaceae sp. PMI808]|nr:hypothetical protein GQ44DRAFT_707193 [Phaeosphaeriaceae sp. PMI808]
MSLGFAFYLAAIWLSISGVVSGGSEGETAAPKNQPAIAYSAPSSIYSTRLSPGVSSSRPLDLIRHRSIPQPAVSSVFLTLPSPSNSKPPTQTAFLLPSLKIHSTSPIPLSSASSQNSSAGSVKEFGHTFGNVVIRNHCGEVFYLYSVGGFTLGGRPAKDKGWGTPQEQVMHTIDAYGKYTEPYRITCAKRTADPKEDLYCEPADKLAGQGIAMKITRTAGNFTDILQVEYALTKDTVRGDTFYRLNYDISNLDCADPLKMPSRFNVNAADAAKLTDHSATTSHYQAKAEKCPGYRNGIAVTFPNNTVIGRIANGTEIMKCKPIHCGDATLCEDMYNFDRTRGGEASLACHEEYRGDMVVDLCAGSMNKTAGVGGRNWTAKTGVW